VGCLVIVPVGNSSLEIKHLAVKKDCQMKGIGKLLIKTALNNFKTNKVKAIVRNTSIPFWEKKSFNPSVIGYIILILINMELNLENISVNNDLKLYWKNIRNNIELCFHIHNSIVKINIFPFYAQYIRLFQ